MPGPPQFRFDHSGIGDVIQRHRLAVPPNQRSYAWTESHVEDLLQDLNGAIQDDAADYFLGTIVLIAATEGELLQIADGQQRLATSMVILARIRDRLLSVGKEGSAESIETDFLHKRDLRTEELAPRLRLNTEDDGFFTEFILPRSSAAPQPPHDLRGSRKRLLEASVQISAFLDKSLETLQEARHSDWLIRFAEFLRDRATVVMVVAPDEVGAFRMFETLNDRGLRASQADILKNYLLNRAQNRIADAQSSWMSMSAAIEVLTDDRSDDRLVTYLRHFWITEHGHTRLKNLATDIKQKVGGETRALSLLQDAAEAAQSYVAVLMSMQHPKWSDYPPKTSDHLATISDHLRVEQIVPLLFAIARRFDPAEAEKAYRLCVSWSVRFLIVGGRGGTLDKNYSEQAHDVGKGRITMARELRDAMSDVVPSDRVFQAAFAQARVSKPYLARYYLRSLDKQIKGDEQPEFVPNEDKYSINLEHVIPLNPGDEWGHLDAAEIEVGQRLLGNMTLMPAKGNRRLGNSDWDTKKKAYAESSYEITREISFFDAWGLEQIKQRQEKMAELAVKTWPQTFD